jgi:flagellar biosynthesis/type III secretory pathway protein FliH
MTTTITDPADVASLLELSAERDQWQAVALARERAAYERGYSAGQADGWQQGYEARYAELAQAWHEAARHVAHGDPRSFAELERRRRSDAA